MLVLFDGNALIHRAYHALPPLTISRTGELVNAIFGFTSMLLKVTNEIKPNHWAIAFDCKAPTLRHQAFKEYKAQRPPMPDELAAQIEKVRMVVQAFHMPIFELEGYEADDLIGTLSLQASQTGVETIIVTGDADTMQLVSPLVKVLYPKPGKSFGDTILYDEKLVEEKFGVPTRLIPDFKALAGDPSDNIPGVPGIGAKTAVKLIQQYGNLDEIYRHLEDITPVKLRELLRENEAIARQSKMLATIVTDVPVELDLEQCRLTHYDREEVVKLFRDFEFNSLLNRLPDIEEASRKITSIGETEYHIISSPEELAGVVSTLLSADTLALSIAMKGNDPMLASLAGVSFSHAPGKSFFISLDGFSLEMARPSLAKLLGSNTTKVTHDGKPAIVVLAEHGIPLNNLGLDTEVAAYLLGENTLALKALALNWLGIEIETSDGGKPHKNSSKAREVIPPEILCLNSDVTYRLAGVLSVKLKDEGLWKLYDDVEMPLVPILAKMERNGVLLDTQSLADISVKVGQEVRKLELEIYRCAGHEFNINSPQQLGRVLFEELGLPVEHKKRGNYSTEAAVLEDLRELHPIVGLVLNYRQLTKLKSTYIDALPGLINPKTRRLHTVFHQTRTATGRLSSSDPNLQNIPIRGELGQAIRRAFIAPPGHYLLSADYSQIDLRVLAYLSQDEELIKSFKNDEDIHTATAMRLFGVTAQEVTPEMRRVAKTVNFGIIYGISGYGLEQATELPREEAEKFISNYFEIHPAVKLYIEKTKEMARTKGYVETILGRRRYVREINSSNRIVREAAERMAINMPVQGTSADIIKVAMVKLDREMEKKGLRSRLLLQVHDELLLEVPENERSSMLELVPDIMSHAIELSVPLKVEAKIGRNWGEIG